MHPNGQVVRPAELLYRDIKQGQHVPVIHTTTYAGKRQARRFQCERVTACTTCLVLFHPCDILL